MTDYKLVEKIDKIDLAFEIKDLMEQGWEPVGGVAIYQAKGIHEDLMNKTKKEVDLTFYVQAMIK